MACVFTMQSISYTARDFLSPFCRMLMVALLGSATIIFACHSPIGGASSKEKLINMFIYALHRADSNTLYPLVHQDYTATQEIEYLLTTYGKCTFTSLRTDIKQNTVASFMAEARLSGTCHKDDRSHPFNFNLTMMSKDDKWFLMLGKRSDGIKPVPNGSHSTTQR